MLRKVLILSAVGLLAMCLSIAAAFFLWHAPADSDEGKHAVPTGEVKAETHEAANSAEVAKPGTEGDEPSSPEHGESPIHPTHPAKTDPHPAAATTLPTIRSGPAFEVAQAALSSLSPQDGLRQLEAALALPHNPEQGALLHEARGELYAQLSPPDFVQSQAAFEQALELSSDTILEEEIRFKAVQMLMQAGNNTEALKVADAQFIVSPPIGPAGLKLKLLQGQLQERAGDTGQAEKSYRAVLDAAGTLEGIGRAESESLARLAALRLTRCYRSHGREKEIEEITALLKKLLGRMQEAQN